MIELITFAPAFKVRSPGPFALKLETYLALAGLEYKTTMTTDPRKGPKGKVPYIIDAGKPLGDSALCISYLKDKYGDTLGQDLTPQQHAIGHALSVMFEERTIWVLIYTRWIIQKNQHVIKDAFFGAIPKLMRGFIFNKVLKGVKANIRGQGMGLHTEGEVFAFGLSDLKAFETCLGDQDYMFGANPSQYDATAYAFLTSFIAKPFVSPMSHYIENSRVLSAYIERVDKKAFG